MVAAQCVLKNNSEEQLLKSERMALRVYISCRGYLQAISFFSWNITYSHSGAHVSTAA